MGLVVFPLAFVDVPVGVDEPASAVGPIFEPVTLVQGEVFPDLFSASVAHSVAELANVPDAVSHVDRSLGDEILMLFVIEFERSQASCDLSSFVVVKVVGLEVVVNLGIEDKGIFGFSFYRPAGFTLVPHRYLILNYKQVSNQTREVFLESCPRSVPAHLFWTGIEDNSK